MLVDSYLEMADNTAVPTTGTLTTPLVLGEAIDLRPMVADNPTVNFGTGEPVYLVVEVTEAFAGTFTSYAFRSYTNASSVASGENASSGGSIVTAFQSYAKASLVPGLRLVTCLSKFDYKRYFMLAGYANATGAGVITAGSVSAYLTKEVSDWTPTNTRTG